MALIRTVGGLKEQVIYYGLAPDNVSVAYKGNNGIHLMLCYTDIQSADVLHDISHSDLINSSSSSPIWSGGSGNQQAKIYYNNGNIIIEKTATYSILGCTIWID